jgi:GAF domain-containing protein
MTDGRSTEESATRPPGRRRENLLSETFVSLADTLVADYDVVDFLDFLVASCMDLFDVSAAGIVLLDARGNLSPMASSNEETRLLELFELQNAEGPCLEAVSSGRVVTSSDLTQDHERWPKFAPAALGAGFRSVQSLPMRLRSDNIGGLNLFCAHQPPLTPAERDVAQALADVATVGILQQRSLHRASLLAEQMQVALDSRIVIEQAKGILAESGRLDMSAAFEALRGYARGSNQKLGIVAEALARRRLDPATVLAGRRTRSR